MSGANDFNIRARPPGDRIPDSPHKSIKFNLNTHTIVKSVRKINHQMIPLPTIF